MSQPPAHPMRGKTNRWATLEHRWRRGEGNAEKWEQRSSGCVLEICGTPELAPRPGNAIRQARRPPSVTTHS